MVANIYVQDCVKHKTRQSKSLNQLFKPKILTFSRKRAKLRERGKGRGKTENWDSLLVNCCLNFSNCLILTKLFQLSKRT